MNKQQSYYCSTHDSTFKFSVESGYEYELKFTYPDAYECWCISGVLVTQKPETD